MANKKRQYIELLSERDLRLLPLAFRHLNAEKTEDIGELYCYVRFSSASELQTQSLNNYVDFCPISTIFIE